MGWNRYVQMICDICGDLYDSGHTYTYLRKQARKEGWSCGKKDICPDCRKSEPHRTQEER